MIVFFKITWQHEAQMYMSITFKLFLAETLDLFCNYEISYTYGYNATTITESVGSLGACLSTPHVNSIGVEINLVLIK
jgi:hypothetical protein